MLISQVSALSNFPPLLEIHENTITFMNLNNEYGGNDHEPVLLFGCEVLHE